MIAKTVLNSFNNTMNYVSKAGGETHKIIIHLRETIRSVSVEGVQKYGVGVMISEYLITLGGLLGSGILFYYAYRCNQALKAKPTQQKIADGKFDMGKFEKDTKRRLWLNIAGAVACFAIALFNSVSIYEDLA